MRINDLNILSTKLGYSEIPLSIFEFFQFLMDILKIWQTGFLYCWLIIINTIVDFSIFLTRCVSLKIHENLQT